MCQSDNNPTIEQTTAKGHQWVFNVARNSRTRRRPSAGPLKDMHTSTVIIILNSELYTRNYKLYKTNKGQRLLTWDMRKIAAGLNMFMRSQPSPFTSSQCRKVNA